MKIFIFIFFFIVISLFPALSQNPEVLVFEARSRLASQSLEDHQIIYRSLLWNPQETAIVISDMWKDHWCNGVNRRNKLLAPRINQFISAARQYGILIVHAPSGGIQHYSEHPARMNMLKVRRALNHPKDTARECTALPGEKRGQWPIHGRNGGCDCTPQCPGNKKMDRRQIEAIEIENVDFISESGKELWRLFEYRNIKNVILVGISANVCVINRSYGLRNIQHRLQKNVVLVRDLTDVLYDPRKEPMYEQTYAHVNRNRGFELVISYIENNICPTISSTSLLGGKDFSFKEDTIYIDDMTTHLIQTE